MASGTIHDIHPDIHTFGLADFCQRCIELAANPMHSMDTDLLSRIKHGPLYTNLDRSAQMVMRARFNEAVAYVERYNSIRPAPVAAPNERT